MQLDFAEVKKIRMTDVLGRYGIGLRFKGSWGNAPCPLPTHKTGDKARSFTINIHENYWRCFSESCNEKNGGKKGGDVINFVALMENCRERDAAEKLALWFGLNGHKKTGPRIESRNPEKPPRVGPETTQKDLPDHNPVSDSVKRSGYMHDVGLWFDEFIVRRDESEENYLKRIKKGVLNAVYESYKNGKTAPGK